MEILHSLAADKIDFEFWLYGVDDSSKVADLLNVCSEISVAVRTFPYMPYDHFLQSLQQVAVGLQPLVLDWPFSQGKSFGKVLANLSSNVAVVASNNLECPLFFRHGQNGMLADDLNQWRDAVKALLTQPEMRQCLVAKAWEDFRTKLTSRAVSVQVGQVLKNVMASHPTHAAIMKRPEGTCV